MMLDKYLRHCRLLSSACIQYSTHDAPNASRHSRPGTCVRLARERKRDFTLFRGLALVCTARHSGLHSGGQNGSIEPIHIVYSESSIFHSAYCTCLSPCCTYTSGHVHGHVQWNCPQWNCFTIDRLLLTCARAVTIVLCPVAI